MYIMYKCIILERIPYHLAVNIKFGYFGGVANNHDDMMNT